MAAAREVKTSGSTSNHRLSHRTPHSEPPADIFRAVADPTRRAILDRLRAGPTPVNALAEDFAQSRPAISKHLRVLRDARLVVEQRSGRERLYELRPEALKPIAAWVEGYRAFWQVSLTNLKRKLESET